MAEYRLTDSASVSAHAGAGRVTVDFGDGVGKLLSPDMLDNANCVVIAPEQLDSMRRQLSDPAARDPALRL